MIPVRTTKNPQPIGARHQWHPRSRPLFSGFPLFPKKPGRSFVPFFPASAIQLSKARSSQERIARSTSAQAFSLFPTSSFVQRQLNTSRSSLPFLIVLPSSVSPTQSTALTTSFVPRHYPPVETLASAAAAGTIGLLETPQSQLHFRQFRNHLLPPLETHLNILTLNDRQIGS